MDNFTEKKLKEFEDKFYELYCGDGTPENGGKSCYKRIKENFNLDEVKNFLKSALTEQKRELLDKLPSKTNPHKEGTLEWERIEGFYDALAEVKKIINEL